MTTNFLTCQFSHFSLKQTYLLEKYFMNHYITQFHFIQNVQIDVSLVSMKHQLLILLQLITFLSFLHI